MEGSPYNQAREEEPKWKDSRADQRKPKPTESAPTLEKAGQPGGPTQAEAHSVSLRQWNRTTTKSKPTKGGKAMSRMWTEEEPRPDQRQVT